MNDPLVVDSSKAAIPIVGGTVMSFLEFTDKLVTYATHWVGFAAAIAGLIWYVQRINREISERAEKDEIRKRLKSASDATSIETDKENQ